MLEPAAPCGGLFGALQRSRVSPMQHASPPDATHTAARWSFGLGMPIVARSGPATGNSQSSSVLLQSGGMRFLFTAPLQLLLMRRLLSMRVALAA